MNSKERRELGKKEKRKQILDAARILLFAKGLNLISMSQIAKQAEIGVGTIYFYYQSKEELFAELQAEGLDLLFAKTKKACAKESDNACKLRAAARVFLKFSKDNKAYFDIINYFLSATDQIFTPNLKEQIDEHGNKVIFVVQNIIEEGIKSGAFKKKIDARRLAILFWAALFGLIHFRKLKNTILKGNKFKNIFEYSVDNFISTLKLKEVYK